MKKWLAIVALLINIDVHAQNQTQYRWAYDNRPEREFDMSKNEMNKFNIEFIHVDRSEVAAACNQYSLKVGNKGFVGRPMSCAFTWFTQKRCVIIVPTQASMHLVGHEVMHCLQGNWHDELK